MAVIGNTWRTVGSLFGKGLSNVLSRRTYVAIYQPLIQKHTGGDELQQPLKPKRPKNAFLFYCEECKDKLMKEQGSTKPIHTQALNKSAAKGWRLLSLEEKDKYVAKFQEDQVRYYEEMKIYESLTTEESRKAMEGVKEAAKEKSRKKALRKKLLSMGMPKRPLNGYMIYLKENLYRDGLKELSNKEKRRVIGAQWNELASETKDKYKEAFNSNLKSYHTALKDWEAKMMEEGKIDIHMLIQKDM